MHNKNHCYCAEEGDPKQEIKYTEELDTCSDHAAMTDGIQTKQSNKWAWRK